jgi:hypothetical protein
VLLENLITCFLQIAKSILKYSGILYLKSYDISGAAESIKSLQLVTNQMINSKKKARNLPCHQESLAYLWKLLATVRVGIPVSMHAKAITAGHFKNVEADLQWITQTR